MGLITRMMPAGIGRIAGLTTDWRDSLPVLRGDGVTLRELRRSDAATLFEMLTTEGVARFVSAPPDTVAGFERFIAWAQQERAAGRYACFAVVPDGLTAAVGLVQVRALDDEFGAAEWGFAIGSPFWGTGVFMEAAREVLAFAFETIGVTRLEARVAVANGRATRAMVKLGAVRERVLPGTFECRGERLDQGLWVNLPAGAATAVRRWDAVVH